MSTGQTLSAYMGMSLAGQRWQVCASLTAGSLHDWSAIVTNGGIVRWEDVDELQFNYVPGVPEKVQRAITATMRISGVLARHIRLYCLLMSPRPAKYRPDAITDDAVEMWESAVSDTVFYADTLPNAHDMVFHRVDRGREPADSNAQATTKSFGVAVANWKRRCEIVGA